MDLIVQPLLRIGGDIFSLLLPPEIGAPLSSPGRLEYLANSPEGVIGQWGAHQSIWFADPADHIGWTDSHRLSPSPGASGIVGLRGAGTV